MSNDIKGWVIYKLDRRNTYVETFYGPYSSYKKAGKKLLYLISTDPDAWKFPLYNIVPVDEPWNSDSLKAIYSEKTLINEEIYVIYDLPHVVGFFKDAREAHYYIHKNDGYRYKVSPLKYINKKQEVVIKIFSNSV